MLAEKSKVAVLGPLGTYSHEAAFKVFRDEVVYHERDSIPGMTLNIGSCAVCLIALNEGVFENLSPEVSLGVVPQENTIFGPVIETYDSLRSSSRHFIRGEITLKVDHCLLVKKGVRIDQIRKIMSHEQALGQCRDFISQHLPTAELIKTPSTAGAAKALLEVSPDSAAIGSSICATLFDGLQILFKGIQNEHSNFTRFFIVAHSQHTPLPHTVKSEWQMRALVRIFVLFPQAAEPESDRSKGIMEHLKLLDQFTSRIDRRPCPDATPFSSIYFVELQGCRSTGKTIETWTKDLEESMSRINYSGGKVSLIGVW